MLYKQESCRGSEAKEEQKANAFVPWEEKEAKDCDHNLVQKLFVERRRRWKVTTQQFVRLQFKLKQFISCCGGAATINELTHKSTCN